MLEGDRESTSHVTCCFDDLTNQPLAVSIPAGHCFIPDEAAFQVMMVTAPAMIDVLPGPIAVQKLPTICASSKNIKPPPPVGLASYKPGSYPDPARHTALESIVAAAQDLDEAKSYAGCPLAPERAGQTIMQLATWKFIGDSTLDPADDVTENGIRQDLLDAAGLDDKSLNKQQRDNVDKGVSQTFQIVDLTLKRAGANSSKI